MKSKRVYICDILTSSEGSDVVVVHASTTNTKLCHKHRRRKEVEVGIERIDRQDDSTRLVVDPVIILQECDLLLRNHGVVRQLDVEPVAPVGPDVPLYGGGVVLLEGPHVVGAIGLLALSLGAEFGVAVSGWNRIPVLVFLNAHNECHVFIDW